MRKGKTLQGSWRKKKIVMKKDILVHLHQYYCVATHGTLGEDLKSVRPLHMVIRQQLSQKIECVAYVWYCVRVESRRESAGNSAMREVVRGRGVICVLITSDPSQVFNATPLRMDGSLDLTDVNLDDASRTLLAANRTNLE
jgi:hypothetical protein